MFVQQILLPAFLLSIPSVLAQEAGSPNPEALDRLHPRDNTPHTGVQLQDFKSINTANLLKNLVPFRKCKAESADGPTAVVQKREAPHQTGTINHQAHSIAYFALNPKIASLEQLKKLSTEDKTEFNSFIKIINSIALLICPEKCPNMKLIPSPPQSTATGTPQHGNHVTYGTKAIMSFPIPPKMERRWLMDICNMKALAAKLHAKPDQAKLLEKMAAYIDTDYITIGKAGKSMPKIPHPGKICKEMRAETKATGVRGTAEATGVRRAQEEEAEAYPSSSSVAAEESAVPTNGY